MAIYGTLEGWRQWALERGNTAPTDATDQDALAALQRASDYIRMRYVSNFVPGCTVETTPSYSELPLVVEATYIAAGYELTTPGFFSTTFTPAQQKVLTKAGDIGWTVVGAGADGTYGSMPTSGLIDALFQPCIFDRDSRAVGIWAIGK